MTPAQVQTLRASWALVEPIGDEAARLFYARLFELDPSPRILFGGDMAAQGRKRSCRTWSHTTTSSPSRSVPNLCSGAPC